jgi:hypothetical protein
LRVGVEVPMGGLDLLEAGGWCSLDGSASNETESSPLLRLLVRSPGALALTLRVANASLCGGALFATAIDAARGALLSDAPLVATDRDAAAPPAGALVLGAVPGDELLLEYVRGPRAPGATCQPSLELFDVVHHFDTEIGSAGALAAAPGQPTARNCMSADCSVDSTCSEGDDFADEARGVFKLIVGGAVCSASLIHDPEGQGRLLALTADHCVNGQAGGSPFWIADFRLERGCGEGCPTPQGYRVLGITVLWHNAIPDLALIQLNSVPAEADAFFNGWSTAVSVVTDGGVTSIHHPRGDYKKISRRSNGARATSNGMIWQVYPGWDFGTVQGGSSGGPLFVDATKRIIGVTSTVDSCTYSRPCPDDGCPAGIFNYASVGFSWNMPSEADGMPLWQLLSPSNQLLEGIDGSASNEGAASDGGGEGDTQLQPEEGLQPESLQPEPCKGDVDCLSYCVGKGGKAPKPDDAVCDDGWTNAACVEDGACFSNFLCQEWGDDGGACFAGGDDAGVPPALLPVPVAFFPLNDGNGLKTARDSLGNKEPGDIVRENSLDAPDSPDLISPLWVEDAELGQAVLNCGGRLDGWMSDTYAMLPDVEYGSSGEWAISMMVRATAEQELGIDPSLSPFAYFLSHGSLGADSATQDVFMPNHINVLAKRSDAGQLDGFRVVVRSKSDGFDSSEFADTNNGMGQHEPLSDGAWHHLLLTTTPSDEPAGFDLYVDGTLASVERNYGGGPIDPGGSVFLCARADVEGARFFTGRMARVAFFDTSLTAEQAVVLSENRGAGGASASTGDE